MPATELIHGFSNIGLHSQARAFPGFVASDAAQVRDLAPRQAFRTRLEPGDLISLAADATLTLSLMCITASGRSDPAALGLAGAAPLDLETFDHHEMVGWAQQNGLDAAQLTGAQIPLDDPVVLRARERATVWVVRPLNVLDVVCGCVGGRVTATIQRAQASASALPEPLGTVRDEFTVKSGTAIAYELARGEYVQIIDVAGQQCSDFTAFLSSNLERGEERLIDSTATRSMVRQAYPQPGLLDKFFDQDMRPMLRVLQDTCGRHDTFGLACTARGYEERGFPGHVNCSDNISEALEPYGVARRGAWPAINFFWNTWIDLHSHEIRTEESYSRPGDYVAMQAVEDLVCVSTACPDDIDPINGWNPTDVHVRIYRSDAPVRRAVAYRIKEDAPMTISRESAFHGRTSALSEHFAPAREIWTPVSYPLVGTIGEYWACRERVTLQDMSGLRKYDIVGPDAERLLQLALTRNVAKLAQWRGVYALMCDETGAVVDDGTLFRMAPDLFRWCCGTEESARRLEAMAAAEDLKARIHDTSGALVNLALQGPKSRELLTGLAFTQPHVPAIEHLKWFGATVARIGDREGAPFMLSRTGYTGELGYEIFCAPADAETIWDAVMAAGAPLGIAPMGSAALEIIRIEAGLAAAGAEFTPDCDAYEAGLGFAVDLKKEAFSGRTALARNAQVPRKVLKGLRFGCNDLVSHGAPVYVGERQIGVVTSSTRSPLLECTIAMARLAVEHAAAGLRLEVGMMDGRMKRLPVEVTDIPFVDPKRERARA